MATLRPCGVNHSRAPSGAVASSPESLLYFGGLSPGPERRGRGQAGGRWQKPLGPETLPRYGHGVWLSPGEGAGSGLLAWVFPG